MKMIDFHTHFFPDHIAREAVERMSKTAGGVKYFGDGSIGGLREFMKEDGVAISVNQPVATKPEQVRSINRKMAELRKTQGSVIPFGTMHPDLLDYGDELAFLSDNGIKGIKLHPEYQVFRPEERRLFKFYEACAARNLAILFHAGADLGYTTTHCTPAGIGEVLAVGGLTVILAHMGAYQMWDESEKYLVGKDVYFDLAYCNEMDNVQLKRMILNHGSDKILFASDFPWERAKTIKDKIDALDLGERDRENIFFKNASSLLDLPARVPEVQGAPGAVPNGARVRRG